MATHELRYGQAGTLRFELPPEAVLAAWTAPRGAALDDPVAATAAAVASPLDFPALAEATVPGDQVVLALEEGVPRADCVVAGVVHGLLEGPAEPGNITIVQTLDEDRGPAFDPRALLQPPVRSEIGLHTHDPADSSGLSYLAASREARPIYLNRTLFDADVVVPIGCLRLEESLNYLGIHAGIFPAFSDEKTKQRFQAPGSAGWTAHQRRRRQEADEAAWLLGTQFTVQVVPGPGDTLLHVLAGETSAVAERGRKLCEAAWRYEVPRRASLVVASIEGGPQQQTWTNFARALFAASRAVTEEGTIVLCTDLRCEPGPALQRLSAADREADVLRNLQRDRTTDALSAYMLVAASKHARVLLLSNLDRNLVEDLGLGYVERAEDISRLSRQHDSCIVLANAQYAVPVTREAQQDLQWLSLS